MSWNLRIKQQSMRIPEWFQDRVPPDCVGCGKIQILTLMSLPTIIAVYWNRRVAVGVSKFAWPGEWTVIIRIRLPRDWKIVVWPAIGK